MSRKNKVRYVDLSQKQQMKFVKLKGKERDLAMEHAIMAYKPTEIKVVPYAHAKITSEFNTNKRFPMVIKIGE